MPGRPYDGPAFEESDFASMTEWGFDFARPPLWYSGRKAERDKALAVAVHVGEWGYLRGSFGLLDSERADVAYEDYKGRKLDRKMLELLRGN